MPLIFFKASCGNGMHTAQVESFPENTSEEELTEFAYQLAVETANSYGEFYSTEEYEAMSNEDHWDSRCFNEEDLGFSWELYVPEKHDMLRAGGGSFLEEFE